MGRLVIQLMSSSQRELIRGQTQIGSGRVVSLSVDVYGRRKITPENIARDKDLGFCLCLPERHVLGAAWGTKLSFPELPGACS